MDTSMNIAATGIGALQQARPPERAGELPRGNEQQDNGTQVNISAAGRAAAGIETPDSGPAAPAATPAQTPEAVATAGSAARAEQPNAADDAAPPALQLYLENAVRPDNQPPPSVIRESA